MCEAYCKWMLNEIGFDGFRYDMTRGYGGNYLSQYNLASKPFFSVSEYWMDDVASVKTHLESVSYNTLAFDFPLKKKISTWKGGSVYSNLKNQGLRSEGLSRFAVTFIDNHDTFHRSDNQSGEFLGYNTNLTTKRNEILAANAYILMLPGVPCVFWPHWYTFRSEIKTMIAIRKALGIHSESEVTDESSSTNSYTATITGHNGKAILRMGSARDTAVPLGYILVYHGELFDIYPTVYVTSIDQPVGAQPAAKKQLENGILYIERNGHRYTLQGTMVR